MKMTRIISPFLALVLAFNLCVPMVSAADSQMVLNNVTVADNYAVYGTENNNSKYNIIVDIKTGQVQFAIVYSDNKNYVYEYSFELDNVNIEPTKPSFWNYLKDICLTNEMLWKETYIPAAVKVIEHQSQDTSEDNINTPPVAMPMSTDGDITYFVNWLESRFGAQNHGIGHGWSSRDGITMYAKSGFQAQAFKDYTYILAQSMTVVGFITGILGLRAGATIVSVIGAIAGTGGLLLSGTEVYKYMVRANHYKYVTIDDGGYPYGLVNKFTYYTGYVYSETGARAVDTSSEEVIYAPASAEATYQSYTLLFNAAYEEYQKIGWQEGNW